MSEGLWEKLLVVAACAIGLAFAVAGAHKVFFEEAAPADSPALEFIEQAPPSSDVAGAVASPESIVPQPRGEPVAAPPEEPDRQDCEAMRGTRLRTRGERRWYIDNCLFVARRAQQTAAADEARRRDGPVLIDDEWRTLLRAAGFSLEETPPNRSAIELNATPPPWLSSHNAIGMAIDWMVGSSPVELLVAPEGCNAIWLNGHFVVTCRVGLGGCTGARCEAVLSFCVFSSEPLVVPDLSC
jgi:hypothetical protein